jgi:hypothetical protein
VDEPGFGICAHIPAEIKSRVSKKCMCPNQAFIDLGGKKSVLTTAPGWHLQRTRIDSMHAVNLGVAQLLIGNVLWFWATNPTQVERPFPTWIESARSLFLLKK